MKEKIVIGLACFATIISLMAYGMLFKNLTAILTTVIVMGAWVWYVDPPE